MDINHLKYFKKTAETQNMTKAAEEIMIAQPALSRVIKNLEKEIGYPLFERCGKNIVLNENGKIFLKYTTDILNSMEQAELEIKRRNQKEEKKVVLIIRSAISLLPRLMKEFSTEYPDITLEVYRDFEEKQQVDADFIIDLELVWEAEDNKMILLEEESMLLVSKYQKMAEENVIDLAELSKDTFYVLKGSCQYFIVENVCKKAGFQPKINTDYVSSETINSFIDAGMGVSIVPAVTWNSKTHSGLMKVPLPVKTYKRYIYMKTITKKEKKAARCFEDFCIRYFKEIQQKWERGQENGIYTDKIFS